MPTGIEWTDETWNPVTGCTNISPGCDNCYAETITKRFKRHPWDQVTLHPDRLGQPAKWKTPKRIFLCSMGDLFHSDVPFDFIEQVFISMVNNSQHTFQVLTKRSGRMEWWINNRWLPKWAAVSRRLPPNIWVGTSVETQKYARRLDPLDKIPAAVRFVSYEPALGPVDFRPWLRGNCGDWGGSSDGRSLDWVIAGGESGPRARLANPDWFRAIRDQCQAAGVPFFFKQEGEWRALVDEPLPPKWVILNPDGTIGRRGDGTFDPGYRLMGRVGKKAAGALLDGREWREFPDA